MEKYLTFCTYFEKVGLNTDENETVKFDFNLWPTKRSLIIKEKEINFWLPNNH